MGHKMKRVLIDNLKGGEVLAQEVWDDNGSLWLAAGATYKNSYFSKLNRLNINDIYIKSDSPLRDAEIKKEFDPERFKIENERLITKQFNRFKNSGSINVYKFEKFVFDMMADVIKSKNIIENMYQMEIYNDYTYEHSVNVTIIAIMICKEMELSRQHTYETAMGCILHDMGKMSISAEILNKPAKLTVEEFDLMKKHPIKGYNIVKENKHISHKIKEIILTHHEKLDGSGYPSGIKGDQISTSARICTISDIFDAMCSKRPYKLPVPFAESLRTMKSSMSKQLDMEICHVLEGILK